MTLDLAGGLATYLEEAWGEPVAVTDVSMTTAGARRHNVLFTAMVGDEPRRLVATIVPEGETLINPIEAEAGVRELAEQAEVAVPHVHLVRSDGDLVGGPFMVSEFVDGETVPRRVLRLVAEHGIGERVARQLGVTLARLHTIDPALAPPSLRRMEGGPPAAAALATMATAVAELPQPRPVLELGLRWLDRHLPDPPERESIVHSDVRNGNLIVGTDGLRAVLDWEGALASGDPMQDLAWPALRMWRFREDELRDRRLRRAGSLRRRLRVGRRAVRRGPVPLVEGGGDAALGRRIGRAGHGLPGREGAEHRHGGERPAGDRVGVGPAHADPPPVRWP